MTQQQKEDWDKVEKTLKQFGIPVGAIAVVGIAVMAGKYIYKEMTKKPEENK